MRDMHAPYAFFIQLLTMITKLETGRCWPRVGGHLPLSPRNIPHGQLRGTVGLALACAEERRAQYELFVGADAREK